MIIDKAREFGIALSETEEFQRMNIARLALEADAATLEALQAFQQKQQALLDLLSSEEEDKLQIAALSDEVDMYQELLLVNPVFAEAMEAQNTFQALMKRVNREIAACIGMATDEEDACSGECEGCASCRH